MAFTDIYDVVLSRVPVLADDPFVVIMFDVPGRVGVPTPFWRYWISTILVGPLFFLVTATLLSLYSGEWTKRASMRREAWISVKGLVVTSPFIAWVFQGFAEGRWGHWYYAVADEPWFVGYTALGSPLLFFVVADATFYFGHRSFHEIPGLYRLSHYHHHSCRPCTSFAGNAADAFELIFTGHANAVMPAFLLPMHAKTYLALSLFNQFWSIYLHNYEGHRMPWGIFSCFDHNVHHHYGKRNYNFGLYFQFWDRVCGTYRASPGGGRMFAGTHATALHDGAEGARHRGAGKQNRN